MNHKRELKSLKLLLDGKEIAPERMRIIKRRDRHFSVEGKRRRALELWKKAELKRQRKARREEGSP